jgi:hypothetical protein
MWMRFDDDNDDDAYSALNKVWRRVCCSYSTATVRELGPASVLKFEIPTLHIASLEARSRFIN